MATKSASPVPGGRRRIIMHLAPCDLKPAAANCAAPLRRCRITAPGRLADISFTAVSMSCLPYQQCHEAVLEQPVAVRKCTLSEAGLTETEQLRVREQYLASQLTKQLTSLLGFCARTFHSPQVVPCIVQSLSYLSSVCSKASVGESKLAKMSLSLRSRGASSVSRVSAYLTSR